MEGVIEGEISLFSPQYIYAQIEKVNELSKLTLTASI